MTVDVAMDELMGTVQREGGADGRGRRGGGDVDMQILRNVRRTSSHSCALMDQLKTLKIKVYGLENDLRHL